MRFQYLIDLPAHLLLIQNWLSRDAETYGHELERDDADFAIFRTKRIVFVDLGKKLGVRIQSNANTVNEKDRKAGLGSMGAVPVADV